MTDTNLRELDEEVARVMGWQWEPMADDASKVVPKPPDTWSPWGHEVPKFSTDPAACKQVKEWLREQSIWFMVDFVADGNIEVIYAGSKNLWVEAPTEEEAVCRFVLALKEEGIP